LHLCAKSQHLYAPLQFAAIRDGDTFAFVGGYAEIDSANLLVFSAQKMTRSSFVLLASLIASSSAALPALADDQAPATQPTAQESSYDKRADSIVASLDLDDSAKAAHVHDTLTSQFQAIRAWHTANDSLRKSLATTNPSNADQAKQIHDSYQALHDNFITALSADLSADQIDKVKEKMTGGQMTATLRNYPEIVPNLTDDEKAMVQKLLEEARDEAIDSGSKNERIAIFKKYKGKINVYLDSHGHNVAQAYKDWGAAQKAKRNAATQPEA
jgi:hypothetical protein